MVKTASPRARAHVREKDQTQSRLLEAAIHLFASKGLDGVTVKELADEAGVNVSLVSYYFGGKEGLYRTCLESLGKERLATYEKLLQPAATADELRVRLGLFMQEMLDFHANNRDLTRMVHRECESEHSANHDIFEKTFLRMFWILLEFLKQAQRKGLVRRELDSEILAGNLIGVITNASRTDFLSKRYLKHSLADAKHRQHVAEQTVDIFVGGILATGSGASKGKKR